MERPPWAFIRCGERSAGAPQQGDNERSGVRSTAMSFLRSEAFARGARMLRTALGPSIAGYLEHPSIVEVMLNPDGRLWIDR